MTPEIFLFEKELAFEGGQKTVSVHLLTEGNGNLYRACVDGVWYFDMAVSEEGCWADVEHGGCSVVDVIGEAIDSYMIHKIFFNQAVPERDE